MKTRLLLTAVLLAVSAGALSGCVVYGRPGYAAVDVEPSVVVTPAPYYYYGYGPRHYHRPYRPYRRW